uniref:Uncharacterized protein n=1 Tax=Anguilla anguilla TaxID=7936 RepID=A0A0E9RFN5_ANGAN
MLFPTTVLHINSVSPTSCQFGLNMRYAFQLALCTVRIS